MRPKRRGGVPLAALAAHAPRTVLSGRKKDGMGVKISGGEIRVMDELSCRDGSRGCVLFGPGFRRNCLSRNALALRPEPQLRQDAPPVHHEAEAMAEAAE